MSRIAPLALLTLLLGGCDDPPTSPALQSAVAGLFTEGVRLEVGEVLTLAGAETQAVFLRGGDEGSEFLYVPFNATDEVTANVAVEVTGGNVRPPAAPANAALASAVGADDREEDWAFHMKVRRQEIRDLTPLMRGMSRGASAHRAVRAAPAVGDTLLLNASTASCRDPDLRQGRVAAVTDRAVVVEDIANPPGGFSAEDFRRVGETFDTLIYPVDVRNFGAPSDIDGNDRVIIFYTRVVNELTPPNSDSFVGGFFFARDLFPRRTAGGAEACPTSNVAEIFYLLAPDPTGAVNQNVRSREFVLRTTLGTVAHEFQHLINASRRIYVNNASSFEEVWLNEGLSHIAEELQFYAVTPLEPRQNIDLATLRASEQIRQAANTYQVSNLARYRSYLLNPEAESLLGQDELPTRGASWAFLRYAADQDPGPDADFFFRLVNSAEAGVRNLANVLEVDPITLMQTWTVSVFTDDAVPRLSPLYVQPSWNFRSIMTAFEGGGFPLAVRTLGAAGEVRLTLKGGGAAFVRFGVAPGQQAVVGATSGGAIPPDRFRVSVVRVR